MADNQDSEIEVIEIDMDKYEAAENRIKVREACTLQYNQRATEKASGDDIVFSSDVVEQPVILPLETAKQALKATNEENMATYGIPNEEIKFAIRESQKPVTFEFLDDHNL